MKPILSLLILASWALAQPVVVSPAIQKPNNAHRLAEKDFGGYVMVYFKDETHSGYFAISRDGHTFADVNGGQPVLDGKLLAEQKGVRDPHIARGPDGAFYLAMTDLHIFGQRAGVRTTQWERPEETYGWGNNRAIVLMKSWDLIHWTHSDFRVDKAFPELGDIGSAWAPQTIYDETAGKMMVYFSIRLNGEIHMYYAYTDDAFTKLVSKPQMLTEAAGIDGDIVQVGGKFHLHYVTKATVQHGVSDRINGGYQFDPQRIDPESVSTEAPNVFKLLRTNSFVLMYDVYGARPNNMGFSETTDFVTYSNLGHFNEGAIKGTNFDRPKHGAVTHVTPAELDAIAAYWKMDLATLPLPK